MKAPKSVLTEIAASFEKNNAEIVFEKYCRRYKKDPELQNIYQRFLDLNQSGGDTSIIKNRVIDLISSRSIGSSGGVDLTLKDRRFLKPKNDS
jgi:hypothetical protein